MLLFLFIFLIESVILALSDRITEKVLMKKKAKQEPEITLDILGKEISEKLEKAEEADPLNVLVTLIGTLFHCDRVYIIERRKNGTFDRTYEWCAPGVASEIDIMQNETADKFELLYERFGNNHSVVREDVALLEATHPEDYRRFKHRNVSYSIADQIIFHGADLGFIGADNPAEEGRDNLVSCLLGLRSYITVLMYSRNLRHTILEAGFMDRLTEAGSRLALSDLLDRLPANSPLGIFAVDIVGLKVINDTEGHDVGDRMLKDVTAVLSKVFTPSSVYRYRGGELIALYFEETDRNLFLKAEQAKKLLEEKEVPFVSAFRYENPLHTDFDVLMRRLDLHLNENKRTVKNVMEEGKRSTMSGKSLVIADLNEHTISPIYIRSGTVYEGNLESMIQERCTSIHPEDQAMFKTFWNQAAIRGRFHTRPTDRHSIVFRVRTPDGYQWTMESMELLEQSEEVFRILLTIETGNFVPDHVSLNESVPMSAKHARADVVMYHSQEFFHRASLWQSQCDSEKTLMAAIDITHFKLYNSIFGHEAGNRMLEMIQNTLLTLTHELHGISGYMGNDNFALMIPIYDNRDALIERIEIFLKSLDIPNLFTPHAGIYFGNDRHELPGEQYEWASLALDSPSESADTLVRVFSREEYEKRRQEQLLMLDIERAFREEQFTFYLQPKVNMETGQLISFEALVRWNKDGKILAPGFFVEAMEKAGMIHELDMTVLHQVCRWLRERIEKKLPVIPVSVNLSRADFVYGNISETVNEIVSSYDIPAGLIQIEITESAFFDDEGELRRSVGEMHDSGHRILLDDFGKGYSSYTSLHSMSLDVLKLDKQFIDSMDQEEVRNIVETIVRMAHMLGLLVIAEGVETKDQAEKLIGLNCYYCQGYHFYKPLPVEEAEKLIETMALIQTEKPFHSHIRFSHLSFAQLINEKLIPDESIDAIAGPLAIIELTEDHIRIIQMNEAYASILMMDNSDTDGKESFMNQMEDNEGNVRSNFRIADDHPGYRSSSGYRKPDGTMVDLEAAIYPISVTKDARFYLISIRELGTGNA